MADQKQPTLEEVLVQLKSLTATVEKLIEAQKPKPAAEPPKPVPANWRDAQPTYQGHSHTFTIPKGSVKDVFNSATPAEAVALPNYIVESPKASDLVDIPATLAALAMETVRGQNRKALYPVALEDYVTDLPPKGSSQREALNIVEGRSQWGFGIVALKARGADGKPSTLYVVDDQFRQQMMVMGTEAIPPELEKKLAESGVAYTIKGQPGTASAINNFLADGAKARGERGMLAVGNTQNVVETLLKACSAICEFKQAALDNPERGTTVGKILDEGLVKEPAVFTSIMKASAKPKGVR